MAGILITQSLQNDFVKPLGEGELLPNQLHVGREESKRLLGDEIATGPTGSFMAWAKNSGVHTVHIRDWHDPNSDEQQSHLQQFGPHCLQNSTGAEFIFGEPDAKDHIINSTTLNDFEDTPLANILQSLAAAEAACHIGIIGVWTEAKVLFLAYELSTRFPKAHIAVCSALTASSSRSQHFLALQQLEKVVGVRVIDSIGEFSAFLHSQSMAETLVWRKNFNQSLRIDADEDMDLDAEREQLLRYLFRDCQSIRLKILDGGFSGNLVAQVISVDIHGHEQAPHVVKIGPRALMGKERTAFEQIESVLGNNAPAIADYADLQTSGALKYRYASMGSGKTRTLQHCFETAFAEGAGFDLAERVMTEVFEQQLGRFYRAAVNDHCDLTQYYCFSSEWAGSVKQKIVELIGHCPDSGAIVLPGNQSANNLYQFYCEVLDQLPPVVGDFPFSFVHGDLNGANIMIDGHDNVWLIDFFHTHRGHVFKDFAKLENDLLYIYTPIESEADLALAFEFSRFLLSSQEPLAPLRPLPEVFTGTAFVHSYRAIAHLRAMAASVALPSESDPAHRRQWQLAQLRYAVHTIGFDEPNRWQRIWALYSAACLAEQWAAVG